MTLHEAVICSNCESVDVKIVHQLIHFEYGTDENVVLLETYCPVHICQVCGAMTLTHLAMVAVHETIARHLAIREDPSLSVEQLREKYHNRQNGHPIHTRRQWCTAIAECETFEADYWLWVHQLIHKDD